MFCRPVQEVLHVALPERMVVGEGAGPLKREALAAQHVEEAFGPADACEGEDEEFVKVVAMPPTLADWLSTRIPLLD